MNPKLKSIIAHLTLVGWIVALIMNSSEKDPLTSFYLRQTLGLFSILIVGTFVPVIRGLIYLILFVFWVFSLIGAIQGEEKSLPFLGEHFQDLFKSIS